MLGAVSGAVAGLVAVTPGAGFVGPMSALIIGLVAGILCYYAVVMKNRFGYDDSLDVVGIHGVGGTWGALATGLFASIAVNSAGADGLFFGSTALLGKQVVSILATCLYAGIGTWILLIILETSMGLRVSKEDEQMGLDLSQHDEAAYTT